MNVKGDLRFEDFRLDRRNQELRHDSRLIALPPKTFAVLQYLAENPARLISKEELLKAVWGATVVGDGLLRGYIRDLRQALGDQADNPRYIETIPRRGFRFLSNVSIDSAGLETLAPVVSMTSQPILGLVGRDQDLSSLHGLMGLALGGKRQVVFIAGEAGIGKTALLNAFLGQVAEAGHARAVCGQCVEQYGIREAYLPIFDGLSRLCSGEHASAALAILGQYAPSWLVQMPGLMSRDQAQTLQKRVQGSAQSRILGEFCEALEALAAEQPFILGLEDLQWTDLATLDLLSIIARRQQRARLMVVGTYRPADVIVSEHPLRAVLHGLRAHRQCTELWPDYLTQTEVEAYLAHRFPDHEFPANLKQLIHRNTAGNPLFLTAIVDELVRDKSIERRAGRWYLTAEARKLDAWKSATVRQLVEGQLSLLPADEQRLLEAAAVAGSEFTSAVIAAALDLDAVEVEERCEALARRRQFVRSATEAPSDRPASPSRYEFLHDLYRTAAFDRSSEGRRRQWYRRIAEKTVTDFGHQVDAVATELAYYFEHADMPLEATRYCAVSGEKAWQRFAYSEAIGQFRRGISLLRRVPASKERDIVELRSQVGLVAPLFQLGPRSEQVDATISRALELNEKLGHGPQSFDTLRSLYVILLGRGDYEAALGLCDGIDIVAQREGDPYFKTEALKLRGLTAFLTGRLLTSRDALTRSIEDYRDQSDSKRYVEDDASVSAGCYLAIVLWMLGYPDQAQQRAREAFDRATNLDAPFSITLAHCYLAMLARFLRDSATTLREAESAVVLCDKYGFAMWRAQASLEHGWASTMEGQAAAGIKEIRSALASGTFGLSGSMTKLAEVCLHLGRTNEGLHAVAEALEYVEDHKERTWEPELHRLKGELLLQRAKGKGRNQRHDIERAERSLLDALERSREIAAKSFELRAAISLHKLWSRQGEGARAKRIVGQVYDWFTEGFTTADLVGARHLLNKR